MKGRRIVALLAVALLLGVTGITQVTAAQDGSNSAAGDAASSTRGSGINGPAEEETISKDELAASSDDHEILWAVIRQDGSIARDHGADNADRLDTGSYEVIFNRDVRGCAYMATIGNPGTGEPSPGEITVSRHLERDRAVLVSTHNDDGDDENHPFHLLVTC